MSYCRTEAPGSLMLFGEHAVLYGKTAIVAAIDRYIRVTLVPRLDEQIIINSSEFGEYKKKLKQLSIEKPYEYVLAAIKSLAPKKGFILEIESDFPATIGFSSSAAVTVAVLAAITSWLFQKKLELSDLCQRGIKIIQEVQGVGSGADIAAAVFGGVISYKMNPFKVVRLSEDLPLLALYSGNKVKTPKVIDLVARKSKRFPQIYTKLYELIDLCTKEAVLAIKKRDFPRLGELMNVHQGLHDALGVNSAALANLVFVVRNYSTIYGAKISGSGLGDSVVALGVIDKLADLPESRKETDKNENVNGLKQIGIKISKSGLSYGY